MNELQIESSFEAESYLAKEQLNVMDSSLFTENRREVIQNTVFRLIFENPQILSLYTRCLELSKTVLKGSNEYEFQAAISDLRHVSWLILSSPFLEQRTKALYENYFQHALSKFHEMCVFLSQLPPEKKELNGYAHIAFSVGQNIQTHSLGRLNVLQISGFSHWQTDCAQKLVQYHLIEKDASEASEKCFLLFSTILGFLDRSRTGKIVSIASWPMFLQASRHVS